jgi:YVTN family beta-propeller protein
MPDGSACYVANVGSSSVTVIDIATDEVINTISDTFDAPRFITITSDGTKAYVLDGSTVRIINTQDNTITGSVADPGATLNNVYGMAVASDDVMGYISNYDGSSVSIISVANNTVTGTITANFLLNPQTIVLTPNGQSGYIANIGSNAISILFTQEKIQAPASVSGKSIVNRFVNYIDIINVLSWTVPTTGPQAVAYNIYRDAACTNLVATVNALEGLLYLDRNRQPNTTYTYYVSSVEAQQHVSLPSSISITTQGR